MTAQPSSQAEREVLASIRARICEQGDMHITVSADEMATLRQALGPGWWEDQDERREIDAMALEMLCVAAEKRAAMLAFSDREHATPRSMPEEVVEARTALVEYAMRYGPRCRECADHGDICPMSGMACGERRKATAFVVDALIYGAAHGHCPPVLIPGASA